MYTELLSQILNGGSLGCVRENIKWCIFKKVYDSVRRGVLCNVLNRVEVPMKLVRLIKMCLNETYSIV
jgi:hypothetical protein